MTKDTYYFSHDSNARNDPKILAMRSIYGIKGYGMYWVIVEMLREQNDYKLKKSKYLFNAIAMQMQCKEVQPDDAKTFVEDCVQEFELLAEDDDFYWSQSLLKRMEIKDDVSKKRSEAAKKRWGKVNNTNDSDDLHSKDDANGMQMDSKSNAIKEKEKKVKEKKTIKDIPKNKYAEFVSLTSEEYMKLTNEHGEDSVRNMIGVLDNYKGSSGKRYKSDYRAILSWVVEKVTTENKTKNLQKTNWEDL